VLDLFGGSDDANLSTSETPGADLCDHEAVKLLFVSATYIAEDFNDSDRCEARGGHDITRDDVRSFDDGTHLSLADLFTAQAAKAYAVATQKGFAENGKDFNCSEPDPQNFDLKSWNITHLRGAWRPVAAPDQWTGECAFTYPVNLPLPKSITSESPKPASWQAFAGAIAHLTDFYLSPAGDYALVMVMPNNYDYRLYAYSVENGVPGKRLAEIPWENSNSRPIVMAQWSSGKYVAAWTDAIQKITEHALAVPVARMLPDIPRAQ
jgi:hypothetical protein